MDNVNEFLCATASRNNFGSISSQIAVALANSIPLTVISDDFAGSEERKYNQQLAAT